jgi:hypothetical protein
VVRYFRGLVVRCQKEAKPLCEAVKPFKPVNALLRAFGALHEKVSNYPAGISDFQHFDTISPGTGCDNLSHIKVQSICYLEHWLVTSRLSSQAVRR